jgi:hypothetical protein
MPTNSARVRRINSAAAKKRTLSPADARHQASMAKRARVVELVKQGVPVIHAIRDPKVGVVYHTYEYWRRTDPIFRAQIDVARAGVDAVASEWTGSHAEFTAKWFGMQFSTFQALYLSELDAAPPGNIVMALWPPEHGKTTTFENYASEKLAIEPNFRMTVASESITIAKKIVGRIRNRMEPEGPFPAYVREFGPFRPPTGARDATVAQPWSSQYFNVYKKSTHDERDYSMMALGYGSSIVSTRCDHLHIDDLQSTKTKNDTDKMEEWLRQDALSRPGEYGKTSIAGTRVAEDDIYERLADDPELDGILKVLRFRAIMTDYSDPDNPKEVALWPERYDLDQLDRQRRKVGQEAWDRNYMQNPGASRKDATFQDEHIDPCKNHLISLHHNPTHGSVVYVALDPALGGLNCVMAAEVKPNKLCIRAIREVGGLRANEQIMQELNAVVFRMNSTANVSDVVIEAMNFQKGLSRDERLMEMSRHYGFAMREHLTGWNKYDEDIGIASMVTSFVKGEIELPWADDDITRNEIGELIRQLKAWKPRKRGNKLRQDRVMALWFLWILWRSRYKAAPSTDAAAQWTRNVPWAGTKSGLIIPIGVK